MDHLHFKSLYKIVILMLHYKDFKYIHNMIFIRFWLKLVNFFNKISVFLI